MPIYSKDRKVCDKPLAAEGLISYRCKGRYGWIMLGATNYEDAFTEAKRSGGVKREDLEVWDGAAYVKAV